MNDVRRKPKRKVGDKVRDIERLGRGQSHDLLVRLENLGLTPELARSVIEGDSTIAHAVVQAIHAATDTDFGLATKWNSKRLEEDGPKQLQVQLEGFYLRYGFRMGVPEPDMTPAEIMFRRILGYEAFYVPPKTPHFNIERLASASRRVRFVNVGQPEWRDVACYTSGNYWFWGEVVRGGPFPEYRWRRGSRHLVTCASVEEYIIMWLHEQDNGLGPFDRPNVAVRLAGSVRPEATYCFRAEDVGGKLEVFIGGGEGVRAVDRRLSAAKTA